MAESRGTGPTGIMEVFLSKLKEQSFVIILMLGVIYYQHEMMEERVNFWQDQYEKKDDELQASEKADRDALTERVRYLQEQQDRLAELATGDK
jgi:predicted DNA repair protein MutK